VKCATKYATKHQYLKFGFNNRHYIAIFARNIFSSVYSTAASESLSQSNR